MEKEKTRIIVFDNIIYSLQLWGGISNYWNYIRSITGTFTEKFELVDEDRLLSLSYEPSDDGILVRDNVRFRYLKLLRDVQLEFENKYIFHSSYYRISKDPGAINVVTVHDLTYELHFRGFRRIYHVYLKQRALRRAQYIVCISNTTRTLMRKFYPFTCRIPTVVIYNGVEEIIPENVKAPFEGRKFSMYVGDRKAKYKNFDVVVEGCALFNEPLLIIGGGHLSKSERRILKNSEYLHLGYVGNSELVSYYKMARALLYPSISEGFGIPIIEAQMHKCPVVTTRNSCIPEVSGDAVFYLTELSGDALAKILDHIDQNELEVNRVVSLGRVNSKRFSWESTRQHTNRLYKEIFDKYAD